MKLCLKILAIAIVAATTYSVIGCTAPSSFSYQNVAITLSVECGDCPTPIYNPAYPAPAVVGQPAPAGSVVTEPNNGQGGTYLFTAHVTNAPANVSWALFPTPNLSDPSNLPTGTTLPVGESSSSVGQVNIASGNTAYYVIPSGIPVYTGAALAQAQALGIPQGMVLLVASVPSDPNDPSKKVSANQLIQIFNTASNLGPPTVNLVPRTPTNPANLTNPVVTVSHLAPNNTFQFTGFAVGAAPCSSVCLLPASASPGIPQVQFPLNSTDNGVVFEVGPAPFSLATAVPGGSMTYGTISATGLYTAPATIPATQPVVYVISHAVPSANAYAYIAVN